MSTLDKYSTINNNSGTISSSNIQEKVYSSKHYDDLFKLVIIGDSGVGKSCILLRFADDTFTDNYYSTIGVDFRFKCVDIGERKCKLQIWDTAGQEKFRAINKFVIRDSKIVLIVYAIDNLNTFKEIDFWINYTKENLGNDNYIMALVANKIDLFEDQVVTDEEGEEAAKKYGIEFFVTRALTNKKRFQYFLNKLIADYIEKYMDNTKKPKDKGNKNIKINNEEIEDKKTKKKSC